MSLTSGIARLSIFIGMPRGLDKEGQARCGDSSSVVPLLGLVQCTREGPLWPPLAMGHLAEELMISLPWPSSDQFFSDCCSAVRIF